MEAAPDSGGPPQAIRRRARAHGSVQGVFFRDSVRQRAQQRGVGGWASNLSDGSVEVVFEGEPEAVEGLLDYVREGPGRARVERVEVAEEEPEGLTAFEVR